MLQGSYAALFLNGTLALCDVDFVGPALVVEPRHGRLVTQPLPFTTAVAHRDWAGFKAMGGPAPHGKLVDLPCAFANTLLRPFGGLLPPFTRLADEVQARHEAIVEATNRGESVPVVQEPNGRIGDYYIGEELGKGTFGRVFAATDGRSGAAVAAKMMPKVNQTKQDPSIHSTTLVTWTSYVRLSVVRVAG